MSGTQDHYHRWLHLPVMVCTELLVWQKWSLPISDLSNNWQDPGHKATHTYCRRVLSCSTKECQLKSAALEFLQTESEPLLPVLHGRLLPMTWPCSGHSQVAPRNASPSEAVMIICFILNLKEDLKLKHNKNNSRTYLRLTSDATGSLRSIIGKSKEYI